MNIAVDAYSQEMKALLEKYRSKPGLAPLRSRALHGFRAEIEAAHSIGYPWKNIWRALRSDGYEGSYPQFARTCRRMFHPTQVKPAKKSLPAPAEEEEKPIMPASDRGVGSQEKPAWQIEREKLMARLDREAELNRQREAQWQPKKVFKMTPFVGRQEPK